MHGRGAHARSAAGLDSACTAVRALLLQGVRSQIWSRLIVRVGRVIPLREECGSQICGTAVSALSARSAGGGESAHGRVRSYARSAGGAQSAQRRRGSLPVCKECGGARPPAQECGAQAAISARSKTLPRWCSPLGSGKSKERVDKLKSAHPAVSLDVLQLANPHRSSFRPHPLCDLHQLDNSMSESSPPDDGRPAASRRPRHARASESSELNAARRDGTDGRAGPRRRRRQPLRGRQRPSTPCTPPSSPADDDDDDDGGSRRRGSFRQRRRRRHGGDGGTVGGSPAARRLRRRLGLGGQTTFGSGSGSAPAPATPPRAPPRRLLERTPPRGGGRRGDPTTPAIRRFRR